MRGEVVVVETWIAPLRCGDGDAAWDDFVDQYRRLIFATIGHFTRDEDEALDVFAHVCEALRAGGMAKLRRYVDEPNPRAQFSTWLVAVVRNQTIDWLRRQNGRHESTAPANLSSIQQEIYQRVCVDGRSHVEAYEAIRTGGQTADLTFGQFLREVRATYGALDGKRRRAARLKLVAPAAIADPDAAIAEPQPDDPASLADTAERVADALNSLAPDERLAVQLFVVDEMHAADVARSVGWQNAKTVYNRVYRCLAAMREAFEREGIRRRDL